MSESEDHKIWCSVGEAVTRLADLGDAITQQSLTKYLNRYAEIGRRPSERDARVTEVDFEALAKHRAANAKAGSAGPKKRGRRDAAAEDMRLRERRAVVELREFQLAERKGELVTRAEVLRAIHAASVALKQTLQRTRFERAELLDAASDVRAKAAALVTQDDALLAAFADALAAFEGERSADDGESGAEPDASGDPGSAEAA